MSSQRYERISGNDTDDNSPSSQILLQADIIPASPPPSFRSRASSPRSRSYSTANGNVSEADRTLADTFDDGDGSDSDAEDESDDRQRLMRATNPISEDSSSTIERPVGPQRAATELPVFPVSSQTNAGRTPFSSANDGVFANLSAKPEFNEKEEQPPTYEQAAADATPPYWETTILAPGMVSDEVFVDGLPVGSLFSFVWNGMISMSFHIVGFLLTYLLHTTHAAKNGSRAGLGINLVQYGFYMKGSASRKQSEKDPQFGQPPDPNSHDFDPSAVSDSAAAAVAAMADSQGTVESKGTTSGLASLASSEWLAYILMIVGWFILIRAVSDFFKARRHEQLILQSPERGLNVPVVAEGERAETVV